MNAEVISIASDIAVGLSALIVAIVAFLGLQTWRKELIGKTKLNAAHNVMSLASRIEAKFKAVRNVITQSTESTGRPRQENESSNVSQVLDEWHARRNRLNPLIGDLVEIQAAAWEAEILLERDSGKQVSAAVKLYISSYSDLLTAIDYYFKARQHEAATGSSNPDQDWLKGLHNVVYSVGNDDFSGKIDEATTKLRQVLERYFR